MVIDPATELCSKKYYQARDGFCLRKQKSQALKISSLNLCKKRLLPPPPTPLPYFAQEHNTMTSQPIVQWTQHLATAFPLAPKSIAKSSSINYNYEYAKLRESNIHLSSF